MLRRYAPMKQSQGTVWPREVRAHVYSHQPDCLGPAVGMPGDCFGADELDHLRASGGLGMKSKSIAVNGARLCSMHHRLKGDEGRVWRPLLIAEVGRLAAECSPCQRESITEYGVPLQEAA
jgi:hypothetical protein